jgi:hypothetical protein
MRLLLSNFLKKKAGSRHNVTLSWVCWLASSEVILNCKCKYYSELFANGPRISVIWVLSLFASFRRTLSKSKKQVEMVLTSKNINIYYLRCCLSLVELRLWSGCTVLRDVCVKGIKSQFDSLAELWFRMSRSVCALLCGIGDHAPFVVFTTTRLYKKQFWLAN